MCWPTLYILKYCINKFVIHHTLSLSIEIGNCRCITYMYIPGTLLYVDLSLALANGFEGRLCFSQNVLLGRFDLLWICCTLTNPQHVEVVQFALHFRRTSCNSNRPLETPRTIMQIRPATWRKIAEKTLRV